MIYPEELVNLLKKHGFWAVSLLLFVAACVSLVLAIVFTNLAALINAMWCSANIYGFYVICIEKEAHEATKEKLADARDQLCISKHDVERLVLELDTAHTALEEMQKTASVGAGSARPNTPTGSQRPKRKPAPKRKLKTTETKDETQN